MILILEIAAGVVLGGLILFALLVLDWQVAMVVLGCIASIIGAAALLLYYLGAI